MAASIDSKLSDEVLLRILSYLPAADLVALQAASSHLHRLASDGLLWKRLYYRDFVRPSLDVGCDASAAMTAAPAVATSTPTLSGLRSLLLRQHLRPSSRNRHSDARRIRRLPTRYHTASTASSRSAQAPADDAGLSEEQADLFIRGSLQEGLRNDGLDWKSLYKVTLNWHTGRFRIVELEAELGGRAQGEDEHEPGDAAAPSAQPASPTTATSSRFYTEPSYATLEGVNRSTAGHGQGPGTSTLVEASPNLVFTASRKRASHKGGPVAATAVDHLGVDVYLADSRSTGKRTATVHRHAHDPTQNSPLSTLLPSTLLAHWASTAGVHSGEVEVTDIRIDSSELGRDTIEAAELEAGSDTTAKTRGKRKVNLEAYTTLGLHHEAAMTTVTAATQGIRLLVAYSTGDFTVFRAYATPCPDGGGAFRLEAGEELVHLARPPSPSTVDRNSKGRRIVASAFHSPLLVTCTEDFGIAIYRIIGVFGVDRRSEERGGLKAEAELIQQMSSYRSCWPACIHLKPLPSYDVRKRARRHRLSPGRAPTAAAGDDGGSRQRPTRGPAFRLTIAYATPAYPASWTIGVQEVVLTLPPAAVDEERAGFDVEISSRHATARHASAATPIDPRGSAMFRGHTLAAGGLRDRRLPWNDRRLHALPGGGEPRSARDAIDRTAPAASAPVTSIRNRFTSIAFDDPFVVLGAEDNLLEVFELVGATTHVRTDKHDHDQDDDDLHAGTTSQTSSRRSASATATAAASGDTLTLLHRSVLYGHTGSVLSVSLENGRCVSGSSDGSVMVWSLGERLDDTESIASLVRGRSVLEGKTESRWKDGTKSERQKDATLDDDEQVSGTTMHHIVTLRAPTPTPTPTRGSSTFQLDTILEADDNASDPSSPCALETQDTSPSPTSSLGRILFETQTAPPLPVVWWVSTAFDKILSVSSSRSPQDGQPSEGERVQIWHFAR